MRDIKSVVWSVTPEMAADMAASHFAEVCEPDNPVRAMNPGAELIHRAGFVVGFAAGVQSLMERLTVEGYVIVPKEQS